MSTIKTRNCVICGSPDIVITGGHVIRKNTFIKLWESSQDIIIIASRCAKHEDEFRKDGYFGEYEEWMGMCDDPLKKEENMSDEERRPEFSEIVDRLLCDISQEDDEQIDYYADRIGVDPDYFREFLDYAIVARIEDRREIEDKK